VDEVGGGEQGEVGSDLGLAAERNEQDAVLALRTET
jgi:hypothetical protein